MYVCMYVCMYVRMHACMHARTYVRTWLVVRNASKTLQIRGWTSEMLPIACK